MAARASPSSWSVVGAVRGGEIAASDSPVVESSSVSRNDGEGGGGACGCCGGGGSDGSAAGGGGRALGPARWACRRCDTGGGRG